MASIFFYNPNIKAANFRRDLLLIGNWYTIIISSSSFITPCTQQTIKNLKHQITHNIYHGRLKH